ncbi:threonine--tRNA ligase [archaeon]|nr:threonine--tRNA ligase [archaeon]
MKILAIHSDYIKFTPTKKALKSAEMVKKEESEMKDCLVVFTSVEKSDEGNVKGIIKKLVSEVKKQAEQVKADKVVLYPYAHLSDDLSKPSVAAEVLEAAEKKLKKDYKVLRAPFGWYKKFEISCKGHPLAEASRSFTIEEKGEVVEKEITSKEREKMLNDISKMKLDRRKLKDNDHRIIGQQLDLFSFNKVAPGMVFWHDKGLIIFNELVKYWREERRKAGYSEISTPQIMDKRLWQISGHWDKYSENNFVTDYEGRPFLVKPMSCPGGMLVYKNKPRSYRELPMRVAELGTVHRVELSGTLSGLFRVIQFTQDDAHIFCNESQMEDEIEKVMNLVFKFYKQFGLGFDHIELSTRPEKRIGSDKVWDKAEQVLENVLKKNKIKYQVNEGDGAFYGPKIDFHVKDSLNRTWQTSTIQLDFATPERFDLEYIGKDDKAHQPVMLHNVIYGAVERFIGILLEHTNGNLPTWLSPIQARVISFSEGNEKSVKVFVKELKDNGIRADSDISSNTVSYKIREAELQKIPYIIVIGDKEEKNNTIAVREKGDKKPTYGVNRKKFIKSLLNEIKERKLGL